MIESNSRSRWATKMKLLLILVIAGISKPPQAQGLVACGPVYSCYYIAHTCPEQMNCGDTPTGCRLASSGCSQDGPGQFCDENALAEQWCNWVPLN